LLLASPIALVACGEPGVDETLLCTLHGDGRSEVAFEATFPTLPSDADEAYADHVAELRQMYLQGWDSWARRFEEAGGAGETLYWEKTGGELHLLRRTARFADPAGLASFFDDTDLTVQFDADPVESELAIFPASPSRATGEQRERLEELVDTWSAAVVRYLEEVADLYAYLDRDPARAEPVFRAIFDDEDDYGELEGDEEERLDRLVERFLEVMDVAGRGEGETDSLERLARLVYDPFPAELSVSVEGEVLAVQGFVTGADGSLAVPPLGLEHALVTLEEVWVEPPLLTTYERLDRLGADAELDIAAFAGTDRKVHSLPTTEEVSGALEAALSPEPEYRLRWRPAMEG
jgi:hypothetical protein